MLCLVFTQRCIAVSALRCVLGCFRALPTLSSNRDKTGPGAHLVTSRGAGCRRAGAAVETGSRQPHPQPCRSARPRCAPDGRGDPRLASRRQAGIQHPHPPRFRGLSAFSDSKNHPAHAARAFRRPPSREAAALPSPGADVEGRFQRL